MHVSRLENPSLEITGSCGTMSKFAGELNALSIHARWGNAHMQRPYIQSLARIASPVRQPQISLSEADNVVVC